MIKMIYLLCVLMLVGAAVLFWVCAVAWTEGTGRDGSEVPSVQTLRATAHPGESSDRIVVSPLVEEATAFALYLRPPAPPAPKEVPQPKAAVQPAPRPPAATPQFRLLATSYCPSSPEKSLALIAEPGKGDRWTRPGEHLGHLVIESVENGTIVYRDGSQRREMAVTMKEPVELARPASALSASAKNIKHDVGLRTASQSNDGGIGTPGVPAAPYEQK